MKIFLLLLISTLVSCSSTTLVQSQKDSPFRSLANDDSGLKELFENSDFFGKTVSSKDANKKLHIRTYIIDNTKSKKLIWLADRSQEDENTGKKDLHKMSFKDALKFCTSQDDLGLQWRLPFVYELDHAFKPATETPPLKDMRDRLHEDGKAEFAKYNAETMMDAGRPYDYNLYFTKIIPFKESVWSGTFSIAAPDSPWGFSNSGQRFLHGVDDYELSVICVSNSSH